MGATRTALAARAIGLAAGGLLAAGGVGIARVEERQPVGGARIQVSAAADAGLRVSPDGQLLSATGVRPASDAHALSAGVTVWNRAARRERVTVHAVGGNRALDRELMVELAVRGERVFLGTVASLRRRGSTPFTVARRGKGVGDISVWLPKQVRRGYVGRVGRVTLEWRKAD
jgi:hypothetical protein